MSKSEFSNIFLTEIMHPISMMISSITKCQVEIWVQIIKSTNTDEGRFELRVICIKQQQHVEIAGGEEG